MRLKNLFVPIWILPLFFMPIVISANENPVSTGDAWKQEYADICGKTQNAMSLSVTELKEFIDRCDRLGERLGELGDTKGPERKVYTKRLEMCRELYTFSLEYREKKE